MKYSLSAFLGVAIFSTSTLMSYTQLPNTELPPDTSPSTNSFSWKGYDISALNSTTSSGMSSIANTGSLVIVPESSSINGTFPVPEDGSNLLYRGFAQLSLGSTNANAWIRVYAQPATYSSVTENGSPTGYVDSDFLLYSKEDTGVGSSSPGWYNGPSYSYPDDLPEEFATIGTGSLVISPTLTLDAITSESVSRASTDQFVLIGSMRSSSATSPGLSTFFASSEESNFQVLNGAATSGTFNGLGDNFLILAQVAQYQDIGTLTPPPSSDTLSEVYTIFTGEGGFFNRDPDAGSFYESYDSQPNLQLSSNSTTLEENSYYQYINDLSSQTPSQITGETTTLTIPSTTLLEFSGDLEVLNGASVTGGTLLFSGQSNTLTVDGTSIFFPDLLVVETSLLTLTSSEPATIQAGGFDLEEGVQIWIDESVVFQTTPGTTWHATTTPYAIPAVPATVLIQGGGNPVHDFPSFS